MKKLLLTMIGALLAIAANAADWYLCGTSIALPGKAATSNWADNANFKLTPSATDANILTISVDAMKTDMKIKEAGKWNTSFGTNGSKIKVGETYKAGTDGSNIPLDGDITDATITVNLTARTVLIEGKSQENDYSVVYLIGDFGSGWNSTMTTYPLTMKSGTTNTFEGSFTLSAATTYFRMQAGSLEYGPYSDTPVVMGEVITANQGATQKAYSLAAGKYNFSFVLEKNATTGKLTVTQDGPVTYPETLYVLGNVDGNTGAFNPTITVALPATSEAGHYQADIAISDNQAGGYGYFQLCTATGTSATDWTGLGTRYGAAEADLDPTTGTMTLTGNDLSWKVVPGTYTIAANLVDKTMTVTKKADPTPGPTPDPTPTDQPLEVTFDFTKYAGGLDQLTPKPAPVADWAEDSSSKANSKSSFGTDQPFSKGNVTFSYNKTATTANDYCFYAMNKKEPTELRGYKNTTFTLTAPEGYLIDKIVFGAPSAAKFKVSLNDNEVGTFGTYNSTDKNQTWSYDKGAKSVTFKVTGTSYFNTINVTLIKAGEPTPTYPVLYFRGGATSWEECTDANKMTEALGVYTFTLAKLNGAFKIAAADWDTANFSTKNMAMEAGTEYDMYDVIQQENADMAMNGSYKDVTVTFDYKAMKLKVEGTAYTPEVAYVMNSQLTSDTWTKEKMSNTAGTEVWEYVVVPTVAEGQLQVVKTVDGTEDSWYGNTAATLSETTPEITLEANGSTAKYSLTAGTEYKLTFDPTTGKLTVATTTVPISYPTLYVRGAQFGFETTGDANKMTETDGVYTLTMEKLSGEFKIADETWSADNSWTSENTAMALDTEYECKTYNNAPNMGMADNLINATITFDYTTKKVKVTGTVDETPVVVTYIIKGTFTDPAWNECNLEKSELDDTYSYTAESLAAATGQLLVVEKRDGVEAVWFKVPATTKLTPDNADITLGTDGDNVNYDFTGADVKTMTFVFTPATPSLKVTWTTGIEGIAADFDANAEYYNLQGVRVMAPATGLYIVVRGATVTKEYVK